MLWTSDVVKDPWFPLVKDPSGSMSSYHTWVKDLHCSLVPFGC